MFPKIVVPQNGWFLMENPIEMDDLGYPYFWKHPCGKFQNCHGLEDPRFCNTAGSMEVVMNSKVE